MDFRSILYKIFIVLVLIQGVLGGPGGYLSIINATPYDWSLANIHSYQMDWKLPNIIVSGTSIEQYLEYFHDHKDDAAEATYTLVGSPSPMSFTIQARQSPKRLEIQFNDALSSLNNPTGSLINLGFTHDGTVSFILTGNGSSSSPFLSTNPPTAWMQATLPTISPLSLSKLCMPGSHDAGMSEFTGAYGGLPHNTITQSVPLYNQLLNGARYFDIRPINHAKGFRSGHFTKTATGAMGATGRSIDNIVKDINKFNQEFPGELILLDINHDMNGKDKYTPFGDGTWQELYRVLNQIEDLWVAPPTELLSDLTAVPLSTFITPGSKSAVLLRLPDEAPVPDTGISNTMRKPRKRHIDVVNSDLSVDATDLSLDVDSADLALSTPKPALPPVHPLRASAYIPAQRLYVYGLWSNTQSTSSLSSDQLQKLATREPDEIFRSTWTITQDWRWVLDVANKETSIVAKAREAWRTLFGPGGLWGGIAVKGDVGEGGMGMGRGGKEGIWPNVVEVDDFRRGDVTGLCLAVNWWWAGAGG